MKPDRRGHSVAVVSADPLLAALIGAAVELVGYRPAFLRDGEADIDAIRRTRAIAVLLDIAHPSAGDQTLLGRALMTGARVIVFGSSDALRHARPLLAHYRLEELPMPEGIESLAEVLARSHPLVRPNEQV